MKIIMINGSPRKKGANGRLLQKITDTLHTMDPTIEIECIHLNEINMEPCTGCLYCYKKGKCYIKDSINEAKEKIVRADGVILASPTYASNVSYLMKLFIDRTHFPLFQTLYQKNCMTIATYENAEGHKTLNILKKLVLVSGGYNSQSFLLKTAHNRPLQFERFDKQLQRKTKVFYTDIQKKNKNPWDIFYNYIVFTFFLKPYTLRNPHKNKGLFQFWYENKRIKKPINL